MYPGKTIVKNICKYLETYISGLKLTESLNVGRTLLGLANMKYAFITLIDVKLLFREYTKQFAIKSLPNFETYF